MGSDSFQNHYEFALPTWRKHAIDNIGFMEDANPSHIRNNVRATQDF